MTPTTSCSLQAPLSAWNMRCEVDFSEDRDLAYCDPSGLRHAREIHNRVDPRAISGYMMARMAFDILLAPEAVEDLRALKANVRAAVRSALETHLRYEPAKASRSRSRIKRLRDLRGPQYRLRVGEVRVFYDVSGATVEILAIVAKSEAEGWLRRFGNPP